MDLAKLSYLRFSMPHCQYVFAQEKVPKDAYNDMNRNASSASAWINKLFTDNSLPHLSTVSTYSNLNKYHETVCHKIFRYELLQFFGYAKSFKKVDDFDKTNATVCMITFLRVSLQIFTVQFEIPISYIEKIKITQDQNTIASICVIISLGQQKDIYFTVRNPYCV